MMPREQELAEEYSGRGPSLRKPPEAIYGKLKLIITTVNPRGLTRRVQLREIPEPVCGASAANRAGQQNLGALRYAFGNMENGLKPPMVYPQADLTLPMALAEAPAKPSLLFPIHPIVELIYEPCARTLREDGCPERGQNCRQRIQGAIEERDPERAPKRHRVHEDLNLSSTEQPLPTSAKAASQRVASSG